MTAVTSTLPRRGIKVPFFFFQEIGLSFPFMTVMAILDGNEAGYGGMYFNLSNEAVLGRSL